jgi:large repetitive protein
VRARRLRHPLAFLAALGLLAAAGASGAPTNAYTASSEPGVVKPATSRVYTIRLKNDATSPDRAQRARIGIPTGFSVSAASAATSAAGTCVATPWVADGTLIANGAVNVKKPHGNTTELCPGGTLTVSITASAPEDGLWTWTTELLRDVAPFALQGPQPTVRVDGTAPVVLIDSVPSDPANDPTPTFAFSANEASAAFECKVDAAAFAPCTSPYTHSALTDGAHTFSVRASDAAGNVGATASHAWTIGTVEPLTVIDAAPAAFSSSRTATFAFSTGAVGATFECKLDQEAFAACTSPHEYADLADGVHNFQVRATDAGGIGSPIGHTWTIDATAPTTTIQTKPPPLGRGTGATFSFSADEAGATFACSLDLGAFAPCTSPRAYSSLGDGVHTFSVRATDRAGNVGLPETYSWTVDTTPPNTTITEFPPSASASTSASFSFTASEPGSSFECQLDAAAFTACAAPRTYAGLGQGQHTFAVRAIDGAGNVDPTPSSVVWAVDTIAPETTIPTKPPAVTNSTSAGFGFAADESATFECKLDAADFAVCGASQNYSSLGEGPHVLSVRARDLAGNVDATPASYTWTIDTVPPETTILSGPADPSSTGLAVFTFESTEVGSTFECKVDAAAFAACTSPASYSLADGVHTFTVRALDAARNPDLVPATATWRIDTLEPDTTITAKPSDPTNSREATFAFSSSDAGVTFECKLDTEAFAPCTSPKSYANLAEARHTFAVRARDGSGNVDQTPATYSWSVDVTRPETSITSGPPNPAGSHDAVFVIGSNEPGASLDCKLDGQPFTPCASPVAYAGLAEGPHALQARAKDAAGNVDQTPAQYSWTIDVTAPTTTIDAGPSGATNDPNATFSVSSGDPTAVFECQSDGGEYAPCTSPKTYSGLADGPHTFRVRARDPAGNLDETPEIRAWTVDTVAPGVTITLPLGGSATNDATPAFSGEAGIAAGDSAMVTIRVFEGQSVAGALLQTFAVLRNAGSWAGAAAPLADGVYTARAEQVDTANNTGFSGTTTFTVDTAGPGIAIFERPADPTPATAATFTFSSGDPEVTLRCSLDGGAFVLCQSPLTYQALQAGRHTFSVNATDRSGNVGGNATYSWTVEPAVQPPAPPPPPPGPPPAPDRTPPTEVANVRARVASTTVTLTWVPPGDPDFERVSITRITPGKTVRRSTIYEGGARSITDRGLLNGVRYRYRLTTRDKAGNTSAGIEVAATPEALLAPLDGAKVASPPVLRWQPIRRATYYNVQLWRVETSGQAQAARLVKILSAWPSAPSLKLKSRWTFAGKSYRFRPGRYRWYVFPGWGKRAVARYGAFLGENTFTVVAPKKPRR